MTENGTSWCSAPTNSCECSEWANSSKLMISLMKCLGAIGRWSGSLRDHQDVAFRVPEPERGRRALEIADLVVNVHTGRLEARVEGFDVVGVQRDPGLLPAGCQTGPGRADGDGRARPRWSHLDPAQAAPERELGPLLEPDGLGVESQGAVLVGGGDDKSGDLEGHRGSPVLIVMAWLRWAAVRRQSS